MRPPAPRALVVLGILLIAGGLGRATSPPASFGWFAYAPESAASAVATTGVSVVFPTGDIVGLGPAQLLGYSAALVGLLTLAFASGYALGQGRRSAAGASAGPTG